MHTHTAINFLRDIKLIGILPGSGHEFTCGNYYMVLGFGDTAKITISEASIN